LFENNKIFPRIDVDFLRYIYTFVSTITSDRKTEASNKSIIQFNDNIFSKINIRKESRDGITHTLSYESEMIVTHIENNIKEHFYDHFSKYINVMFDYLEKEDNINKLKISEKKKKEKVKILRKELYDIKMNVLSNKALDKSIKHRKEILQIRHELFSHIPDINEKGITYDVYVQPQQYLYSLFKIIKYYEKKNEENKNKANYREIKLFSVLPMRTTLIPRNITFDTLTIIQNFKEKLKENLNKIDNTCENIEDLRNNFCKKNLYNKIWSVLFNMNDKFFKDKNKYKFNFFIKTNGVSCSAQFKLKNELIKYKKPKIKSLIPKKEFKYIDDIDKTNRFNILTKKNVVCIDPNKRDLMYCGTYKNNEFKHFRYTQMQRRKETQNKNHKIIRKELEKKIIKKKREDGKNKRWRKEDDKTLKEYELEKTKYSMKSINTNKISENINETEKINFQIKKNYEKKIYRKLEWNRYINREKTESKMIKNFGEKMGKKEDTVVIVGDYSVKSKNMKGTLPAIAKRILTIFKKQKYEVYVIDERYTSKTCNECENETEMFYKRKSKKPKLKGKKELVSGLLRCQSLKCKIIHNRDKNAVKNMLKIIEAYKNKSERQKIYCEK
jgi:RNase H-fold protein (predicted Holliday junction resolvase)